MPVAIQGCFGLRMDFLQEVNAAISLEKFELWPVNVIIGTLCVFNKMNKKKAG